MISQALQEARTYEKTMEAKIAAGDRPMFHFSTRVGWLNDPNGFSFYQGEYHLFYQYHPYHSFWGPMHWGHAVSKDLLHWKYLPAAMAPDAPYDKNGCFSGSAIDLPDGRQLLMYTGVRKETQPDGSIREIQTQCVAAGNGMDYEKYEGNPVLTEKDLPTGGSRFDFRDPKLWKEDGVYYCVVGNCTPDRDGRSLLYASEDGFHWKYVTIVAENKDRFGKMWECPDFFALDGKQVLFTSPQDMLPQGLEYHNGNGTLCLIGTYDKQAHAFTEERNQSIDYGIDFYAPQTLLAPDGRRIMIAWMQNWDTCNLHTKDQPWFGQMCLPRELSIRNHRLIQTPIRELDMLRGAAVRYENVKIQNDTVHLDGIHGRKIDMEINIRPSDEAEMFQKFAVRFAQNAACHTAVSFRPHESIVKVDRKFSGSRRAIINQRRGLVRAEGGCLKLRLILDSYSAEVFVNDGEQVFTITFYTDQASDGISFFVDGEAVIDVVKYDLMA